MRRPAFLLAVALAALAACRTNGPLPPPEASPASSASSAPAPSEPLSLEPGAAARIRADVTWLAAPELAGRGTGDPGADRAADYIARRFESLELAPFGDRGDRGDRSSESSPRGWRQAFSARVSVDVEHAAVSVAAPGKPPAEPVPAAAADGSASGKATGKAIFVGHGISAAAVGWDDYAKANVEGAIVVVLDGAPRTEADKARSPSPDAAGAKADALRDFGSIRYKLRTAREHKAAGAVIITRSAGAKLFTDSSSMGVPAVVVNETEAKRLFPALKVDWAPKSPAHSAPIGKGEITVETRIVPREAKAWNVAALLPARPDSKHADEYVVVGAHYDHLGMGGTSASLAPGVRAVHPGADDNASGTALLLEVARRLKQLPRGPERNVVFVAFGAEELGALGSRHWVEHPPIPLANIAAMINADMVGRLRDRRLVVDGVGTAAGWKPLIEKANQGLGLDLAFGSEGFGASDHMSFTAARVPVAFFFTGAHDDYHRPSDTADKVNVEGEATIATLAARLALAVADADDRLVFVDAPADPHRGVRGGFKVSLGTIPDYGYQGKGLRLSGVRPDAPAARAGLVGGDLILKVGAHEITNIHDYMFALGELEPGREVTLEIERGGQRIQVKVIPAPGR